MKTNAAIVTITHDFITVSCSKKCISGNVYVCVYIYIYIYRCQCSPTVCLVNTSFLVLDGVVAFVTIESMPVDNVAAVICET